MITPHFGMVAILTPRRIFTSPTVETPDAILEAYPDADGGKCFTCTPAAMDLTLPFAKWSVTFVADPEMVIKGNLRDRIREAFYKWQATKIVTEAMDDAFGWYLGVYNHIQNLYGHVEFLMDGATISNVMSGGHVTVNRGTIERRW